jgi:anti-anti-sigma factor
MPATLGCIDRAISEAEAFISGHAADSGVFAALTVLREALLNAVVHGCRQDPALIVSCGVSLNGGEAVLTVSDPGPGFPWRLKSCIAPGLDSQSGRGICIMREYCRQVAYNDAGNHVTLRIDLGQRDANMSQTDTQGTVVFTGDVVASGAEALRQRLREAMASSPAALTLDMAAVAMVDSVGLGLLIAAHNSLAKSGGRLCLVNVSEGIRKLLRAMRLDRHFQVNP